MADSLAALTGESRPRRTATVLQPACSTGWHDPSMHESVGDALSVVRRWGADHAALAVVGPDGDLAAIGDGARELPWASVTKPVIAYAVLRAVEQGSIALDEPLGPPGATVRHLLAHASGLPPDSLTPISPPERTRIYSNAGFDLLGELLAERAGQPVAEVVARDVLGPLDMTQTRLVGRASAGIHGSLTDLARFGRELLRPTLIGAATLANATTLAFPGLAGVLPGLGRYEPLDWGLGFELRDAKQPHWTGTGNSPETFGHFGASGTFLWVDPVAGIALACLTDRLFGPWALEAWPAVSDAVLAAIDQVTSD
jgi:CubicO group peptidase (beta-lactamase class C family)